MSSPKALCQAKSYQRNNTLFQGMLHQDCLRQYLTRAPRNSLEFLWIRDSQQRAKHKWQVNLLLPVH